MDSEYRVCKVCNKNKPITDYPLIKRINKYSHTCKECRKIQKKAIDKRFYQKHKEDIKAQTREYYFKNKDTIQEYKKEYAIKNKDKLKEYKAKYYLNNRDELREKYKEYYKENAEQLKQYQKDYKSIDENREKVRIRSKQYKTNKLKTNELYKITEQLRNMIRWSFYRKGYAKKGKTRDIIGTDYDTFYNHLLETYKNNYGYEWDKKEEVHIDHIIPISTAKTEQDIYKLCHYTNLQLLKAKDNLDKSNKLDYKISDDS